MKSLLLAITFLISATAFSQTTTFVSSSYRVNDLFGVEAKTVTGSTTIKITDKKVTVSGEAVSKKDVISSYTVIAVKKEGIRTHYLFAPADNVSSNVSATVYLASGKPVEFSIQSSDFGQIIFKK